MSPCSWTSCYLFRQCIFRVFFFLCWLFASFVSYFFSSKLIVLMCLFLSFFASDIATMAKVHERRKEGDVR